MKLHRSLTAAGEGGLAARMAAEWRKVNPKDVGFLHHLGDTALAAKRWPEAEAIYRAVLALQPRHAAAMNNVAWLMAARKLPGAAAMARQALALLPDRAALLDTLAFAQEAENLLPPAIEAHKRAAELEPRSTMLRLRLAQLLVKHGDKSDARKELEGLSRLGNRFEGQAEVAALLRSL